MKKLLSVFIALIMLFMIPVNILAADGDDETTDENTTEIALLIISASFDANGNGVNDYDPANPTKLYSDPQDDYFGEQWAEVSADAYYDNFFGSGYSVSNFYEEMTMGKIKFVPVVLDVPKDTNQKDGCIDVVIEQIHPSAYPKKFGGTESQRTAFCTSTIDNIIKATDEYIDYTKYDRNGNGVLESDELIISIMNPGPSQEKTGKSENFGYPRGYFAVWSTSQGTKAVIDGLTYGSAITNMGEYTTAGNLQTVGTACHEICHNLGAEDIYDRKVGASGTPLTPWPWVGWFSLQHSGNYSGGGSTPTYLDPYQRVYLGWADEVVVGEGEYTLYSTMTRKYQVLRINTPDPDEYYLVEIRLKEGFEKNLASKGTGGICVWHIDETSNRKYFIDGTACSNYMFGGSYHDPGIVVLHASQAAGKTDGLSPSTPGNDPFYYGGDSAGRMNRKFESMLFRSPLQDKDTGDYGLNTYPKNWIGEKYYNVIIEPLTEPGQEMTIKISIDAKGGVAPTLIINTFSAKGLSLSASGSLKVTDLEATEYGFMISTDENFENDVQKVALTESNSTAQFRDLAPETTYYSRMYAVTEYGTTYGAARSFTTAAEDVPEESTEVTTEATTEATTEGTTEEATTTVETPIATTEGSSTAETTVTTEETTPNTGKSGCGSLIGETGIAVCLISIGATVFVRKKKQDDKTEE